MPDTNSEQLPIKAGYGASIGEYQKAKNMGLPTPPKDVLEHGLRDFVNRPEKFVDKDSATQLESKLADYKKWRDGAGAHSKLGRFYAEQVNKLEKSLPDFKQTDQVETWQLFSQWDKGLPFTTHGYPAISFDWQTFDDWKGPNKPSPTADYATLFKDFQSYSRNEVVGPKGSLKVLPETIQELNNIPGEVNSPANIAKLVTLFNFDESLRFQERATQDPILALSLKLDKLAGNTTPEITSWVEGFRESSRQMLAWLEKYLTK